MGSLCDAVAALRRALVLVPGRALLLVLAGSPYYQACRKSPTKGVLGLRSEQSKEVWVIPWFSGLHRRRGQTWSSTVLWKTLKTLGSAI